MNCKETEKNIISFLNGELDGNELVEFVNHIDQCEECMEELTIQFLVSEGLEQLEDGDTFNLQDGLMQKMNTAKHKIHLTKVLRRILLGVHVITMIALIITIVLLFQYIF